MEQNSQHRAGLLIQLKEAYGKVVYTYTSHLKQVNSLENRLKLIKYAQILLSALSTGGFLGAIITNENVYTIIAGFFSTVLLAFNLFFKNFNLESEMKQHIFAADELWLIREKYVSLMTDFDVLGDNAIVSMRDTLLNETYNIYKKSPKTNSRSYSKAQKALKNNEEQFFSDEELNQMLPSHLRTSSKS